MTQFLSSFNGKPKASAADHADAFGVPLNEPISTASGMSRCTAKRPT
jgi:hypothetical protein